LDYKKDYEIKLKSKIEFPLGKKRQKLIILYLVCYKRLNFPLPWLLKYGARGDKGEKFMVANPQFQHMSPREYLEWEATQEVRYEYIDGEVVAMTGGTKPHNRIALNLATALDGFLGGSCDVYIADVKVQISTAGPYHYPDVVVTCDARDKESNDLVQYPCLIVEVLSPSTESVDRGKNFTRYRQLTTLKEYVLIESEEIGVECFRRNEEGFWVLHPYGAGEILILESVGFSIPVEALYIQVKFDVREGELEPQMNTDNSRL